MNSWLKTVSGKCIECMACVKECAFLQEYGTPKSIADSYDPQLPMYERMPFACSLCGLCSAVCPVGIHPSSMFLEMRREAVERGGGRYREHSVISTYERRGTSKRFTFHALPECCDTVLFPGCALSGTRPERVVGLYDHLGNSIPGLGIVLDCCCLPSHDLGRHGRFQVMFDEMKKYLLDRGVRTVLVACASCHKIFKAYGGELSVKSVYETLMECGLPETAGTTGTITIHDPCAVRFESAIHDAVRDLTARKGLAIREMPHHREKALCCGEGGSAGFLSPELAGKWKEIRRTEAKGSHMITCCAGCASSIGTSGSISHILDLLFEPEATMAGTVKVSRTPVTYWNRLRLKNHFMRSVRAAHTRERTLTPEKSTAKSGVLAGSSLILKWLDRAFAFFR